MGLKGEDGESRTRKHGDGKSGHRDMKQRHGDMKQRHGDSKQKHGDMQQRQGDGVKKRQGENKPISYGEKVKRRRLEAVASIAEEGMSISQKRKLVVREEKLRKNPAKAFERGCNKLYGDLLKCSKSSDKTAIEESVSKMLIFLYEDGNSPLLTLDTKDAQSVTTIYAKPCISRALQLCLKKGSEKNREMIEEKTRNVFDTLAQTSAGHHLCMKLFLYSRSKKEFEVLMQKLYDNPKSFFTKFGFRVWDCAMRRVATAKCRNTILMKLFFEKVLRAELGGDKLNELSSPVEAYKQLTKGYRDIAKERLFVAVDKIVKKEMLESEIVQQLLKTMTAIFDFEASEPEAESKTDAERSSDFSRLSGAIFEGAHVLLATKEGVSVLCRLCGYWTAKERKQFVANMKQQMTLGQQTWRDYLLNDLDALFVTRFILTIDDTRLTKESVLGEIFATKVKALQFKLQDPYAPYDILQNLRATAMLIAVRCHTSRSCLSMHNTHTQIDRDMRQLCCLYR